MSPARSAWPRWVSRCAMGALLAVLGCARNDAPAQIVRAPLSVPAPDDHGAPCLDVGDARACWDGARDDARCRAGRCVVARPAPPFGLDAAALRCSGQASERRCDERTRHASAFACSAGTCTQARARTPDAAEWECAEIDGAMVCRRVASAAGVPDGATDPAFVCGMRTARDERICVDLAPDRPPLSGPVRCKASYAGGSRSRSCAPARGLGLGDACEDDAACPRDALCVAKRCLPPRPEPACWLDADCGARGRCRWGSCVGAG